MKQKNPNPIQNPLFHLGYQPSLDGIRGFAVLWVMGFHYQLPFSRQGLFGVDIFFTLSGFLITVLLVQEWERYGRIQLKFFYLRRILRLFPALILILIVFYTLIPKPYIFSTIFYYTNWIKALHFQPDSLYLDHVWSLSIEEQFYLIWPAVLITLLHFKIPKKTIVLLLLMLGLSSAVGRILVWNSTHDWFRVYMATDLHADGLLIGSAFGFMQVYGFHPDFSKHKRVFSLTTLLTVLLAAWLLIDNQLSQSFIPNYGILGVSIGTIIIIARIVNIPSGLISKIFCFSPLVKIGMISYGLYLWHAPIGALIDQFNLNLPLYLLIGLKILLTFLAAGISYKFLERPILNLKRRFNPNQKSGS